MTRVLLPTLPSAEPQSEAALFGFDDRAVPVRWPDVPSLPARRRLHLQVRFAGIRPEDARLYAPYLGESLQ